MFQVSRGGFVLLALVFIDKHCKCAHQLFTDISAIALDVLLENNRKRLDMLTKHNKRALINRRNAVAIVIKRFCHI